MTNLSPAAQAVYDAFWIYESRYPDDLSTSDLANALRTAVHQLNKRRWAPGVHWARMELLAIADELEAS